MEIDNVMEIIDRELGKRLLRTIIEREENVDVIEEYVFERAADISLASVEIYLELIYFVLGKLIANKTRSGIKNVLKSLCNGDIWWKDVYFDHFRTKEKEEYDFLSTPADVEDGVLQCNRCQSWNVYSYQKQTRGCDEGATTFAECTKCGNKWKNS